MRRFSWAVLALGSILTVRGVAHEVDSLPWNGEVFAAFNGDTNGDMKRDLSDIVYLLGFLYSGGPAPTEIAPIGSSKKLLNGDANGDGDRDISDVIHMLQWQFSGGEEPASIFDNANSGADGMGGGVTVIHSTTQSFATPPPRIDACTGEVVSLAGNLTSVQHSVFKPDGGSLTTLIIRWHSLTGTGSLGTEYIVNGGVSLVVEDLGPGQTFTTVAVERLITPGNAGNNVVTLVFHVTMLADGTITADISDLSIECVADND